MDSTLPDSRNPSANRPADRDFFARFRFLPWAALLALLGGCGGSGDISGFEAATAAGRLNIRAIHIESQDGKLLFEPGETWPFSARATLADGSSRVLEEGLTWRSSNPALVSIDSSGQARILAANGNQSVDIRLSLAQFSDSLTITVSDATLTAIEIRADQDPMDECREQRLQAAGLYSDGSLRPLGPGLTWTSGDPSLARFDPQTPGLLRTHASGIVDVLASRGAASGSRPITISDTLASLTLVQGPQLQLFRGASVDLAVLGSYSGGGSGIPLGPNAIWTSSAPQVAGVDSSGRVTGLQPGTALVTAACGGLSATLQLVVVEAPEVIDLVVVDEDEDTPLRPGESRRLQVFEVLAGNQRGTTDLAREVDWTIDTGGEIAEIDDRGNLEMANDFSGFSGDFIIVTASRDDLEDSIRLELDRSAP